MYAVRLPSLTSRILASKPDAYRMLVHVGTEVAIATAPCSRQLKFHPEMVLPEFPNLSHHLRNLPLCALHTGTLT